MKFADIPKFPRAYYSVNVGLDHLQEHLDHWNDRSSPLVLNPEWQRGRVWTESQKIAFMEYFLKGGTTGKDVYFNCSSWQEGYDTPIYCLDGLQRITAATDFLENKIPVFGVLRKDFEDRLRMAGVDFRCHVLNLKKKTDLLKVYIDFNSGGTPHNPKEIARIEKMLKETSEDTLI